MFKATPHSFLFRFVVVVAGLSMIALGLAPLLQNDLFYTNWFGGLVLAPLAILFGLIIIACAIFKPDWLKDKRKWQKGRWQ
jgi:hypothetical protein